ncbi:MAG TPA: NAD-dependent epimerase/dehydratase family protein [Opitutaceae bacterium]
MHVLVTGGAGFIGSHLVRLLLSEGHRLTIVDNFASGQRANIPRHPDVTLIEKDLLAFPAAQWPRDLDAIVHLAAQPSVVESWTGLRQAHDVNLSATVHALEAARELGVGRFLFASSAAVYGDPVVIPLREDAPALPLSPYGLQKLAGEHYGRLMAQSAGLRFVALRLFNVFGPGQDASSPYSGVISRFMAAMDEGASITIRGDGRQTRDFVFVKDVAGALSAALRLALTPGDVFISNIGSGSPTTVLELAHALRQLRPDWQGGLEHAPAAPGEIRHSTADTTLARERLRFAPQWTLRSGLQAMITDASPLAQSDRP